MILRVVGISVSPKTANQIVKSRHSAAAGAVSTMLAADARDAASFTHRRRRLTLIRFSSATEANETLGTLQAATAA